MSIDIKHYPERRMCDEFFAVIEFLKRYGAKGYNKNWHWARWEWLISHPSLNESTLPSIGLFMDDGKIVGLVTHDMRTPAYIILNPQYDYLKPKMVDYAIAELSHESTSSIFADEDDKALISAVKEKGYSMTADSEYTLELDCSQRLSYHLGSNFLLTDYDTDKNLMKYTTVIHKGFGNEGEPAQLTESDIPEQPNFNPKLALFLVAPGGDYAAHCGIWYSPDTKICYVEPVATIPEYRKRGLGKAVVLEAINRCNNMGAQKAIVISNQRFYYQIGFQEYSVHHLWKKKM